MRVKGLIRTAVLLFLRIAFRVYYRAIHVQGLERVPAQGPVLLVANHPNSLLDPALLIHLVPRTVRFGAKHTLFAGPLQPVMEAFGAIRLVRASDDPRAMRKNLEAFDVYARVLQGGDVAAIFPEGISQDEMRVAPVKSGAARIALKAESESGFHLGLVLLPVGLQFEPRRRFRADALVRIGEPVPVADLSELHGRNPREAVRVLTDRIDEAIKRLALHVETDAHAPLVERLADVYLERARRTGLAGARGTALRAELLQKIAVCVNHYAKADPEAVAAASRALTRYDRLRETAGIDRRLLEEPERLLPTPFGLAQMCVEGALGLFPALFGALTCGIPYLLTRAAAAHYTMRRGYEVARSLTHVLAGAITFPLAWGLQIAWVHHAEFSRNATIAFCALLAPTGLFALAYVRRMRKIALLIGGRVASWFRMDALARVRSAREELISLLDRMRDRYRTEVLGWPPVKVPRGRKRLAAGSVLAALVALLGTWLVLAWRDRPVAGLPSVPSPWDEIRRTDPALAQERLRRDALSAAHALAELDRVEARMRALRAEFAAGRRSYYKQDDADEVARLLLTYLNLRTALLRTVWMYRGEPEGPHGDPRGGEKAFLVAYASASGLLQKAAVLVETFGDDPLAQRKLNEGDAAWGIPGGNYDQALANLASGSVLAEMRQAQGEFDALRARGAFPQEEPYPSLERAAIRARPAIERAQKALGERKLAVALRRMRQGVADPYTRAQAVVSTWIGDFRIKDRPPLRGLISPGQTESLRGDLRPGDILVERRNWFMSNAFLPGYWPHAALYLGTPDSLRELGVADDPRVTPHWGAFLGKDAHGHAHAVIEADSEGVHFTSLEHSAGEADGIVALRPRVTDERRREAICRAISHYGKPYDFDFDFFSTHALVCTEVVFRAYDGAIDLPLTTILGRKTLPAQTFVQVHVDSRGRNDRPFDMVRFLDADEEAGRAVERDEDAIAGTLERSRFSFAR
ncbi:MAG: 1-acyl-sn-glycerol-3-phosphate acyltransferase [Planctomycetes bacterium]|nr:1-acyl-sn-glycerol-3-phosphate acyltransferase [Planctomycetota bacterium]